MKLKYLLCGLPLLLTGCGILEVGQRSFIQTAGVTGTSQTTVSLLPFSAEEPVTAQRETLLSALETVEGQLPGAMFLGHTELLAVGTGDLPGRLSALLEGERISPSCLLVYASDGSAPPALLPELKRLHDTGRLLAPSCGDGLRQLLGRSETALLPTRTPKGITLAVVNASGEVLELLDADACRGAFWLSDESAPLMLPVTANGAARDVSILRSSTEVTARLVEGGVVLRVSLRLSCEEADAALRNAVSQRAEQLCRTALAVTLHAHGTDILGAEAAVQRADGKYYAAHAEDWRALLRDATVEFEIRVTPEV